MASFERGFSWIYLSEISAGDLVHRWGDDLLVVKNEKHSTGFILTVLETDGEEKSWTYKDNDELIAKKSE